MKAFARLLCVLSLSAFCVACGGGGGSEPPPPPPDRAIGGAWVGTDSSGLEILALITENGRVNWVAPATGEQGFGTGSVNFNAVTIDYKYVAKLGSALFDRSAFATCSATGIIQERQSLAVTTNCLTSLGRPFTNSASLTYDPLYDRDSSLSVIAGNYDDFGSAVSIDANGEIFEQDPVSGCINNGQISIINSQFNAYNVSITYSTCVGDFDVLNGATFTGLAILDNTVTPEQIFVALTGEAKAILGTVTISIVLTLRRI